MDGNCSSSTHSILGNYKTMKAYTQLIENKVMVSTLPKPDTESYSHILLNKEGVPTNILNSKEYQQALKEFNDSIIGEVENARHFPDSALSKMTGHEYYVKIGELISQILENDPCEVEKSGDKWKITSLT